MDSVERTARTVEEAEELALKELGVDRNEVEVEILSRGKAGFLGIGAEVARVRVTMLGAVSANPAPSAPASEAPAEESEEAESVIDSPVVPAAAGSGEGTVAGLAIVALNNILSTSGVNVSCTVRTADDPEVGGPVIDISGEDSGLLIGRRGQTLQSLQFIVNLIVRREFGESVRVVLDVESYRQRREASLRDMATKVAERVLQTGRSITLEPMSAADRRIVHISLADREDVSTESVGLGEERKVTIIPKR
ncbi:MAG: Jag N-terminal domain-containing protein [Chloroflexi bacterium]|nr:Jag N-terminal domain-containing protein [Chloroflexota bacterium]